MLRPRATSAGLADTGAVVSLGGWDSRFPIRLASHLQWLLRGSAWALRSVPHRDGEALNAARLADKLVRKRGTTRSDVLSPAPNDRQLSECKAPWRTTREEILARPGDLGHWERGFLQSLSDFPRLSIKQGRILNEINPKACLRREHAA